MGFKKGCIDMIEPLREDIYRAIDIERDYQDSLVAHKNDSVRVVADWVIFMEHHLRKATNHVYNLNSEEALHEIRKVTALGVACMENLGIQKRETK